MGRKLGGAPKEKRRKRVNVKLIERMNAGRVVAPYQIMEDLIERHHSHLAEAKIAMAWRFGWRPDADGRLRLGQCRKGSDLDRELHQFDFVILLNHEAWNRADFSAEQQAALVDHQLCHAQVAIDTDGEPKADELGRTVYRIRRHDVEEFRDVVARHGLWTDDLEKFASEAMEKMERPLLKMAK